MLRWTSAMVEAFHLVAFTRKATVNALVFIAGGESTLTCTCTRSACKLQSSHADARVRPKDAKVYW